MHALFTVVSTRLIGIDSQVPTDRDQRTSTLGRMGHPRRIEATCVLGWQVKFVKDARNDSSASPTRARIRPLWFDVIRVGLLPNRYPIGQIGRNRVTRLLLSIWKEWLRG